MKTWQSIDKKRVIVVALIVLVLLVLTAILYFKKDPSESIEEINRQEIIIQEQLGDLEAIREERRGGEEYVPPAEEDIQRQIDELDSLRRRE